MRMYVNQFSFYALVAAALAFIYLNEISVFWYASGLVNNFSFYTLILGTGFFVLLAITAPKENSARGIILHFFALTHVLPSTILYIFGVISLKTQLIVMVSFLVLLVISNIKVPKLAFRGLTERHFLFGVLGFQALIIVMVIRIQGFGSFNLDIMKIYDFRREVQSNLPGIFTMLNSWSGKVLLPLGLILALKQRNYFALVTLLSLMVLLFGLTQHKSTFILPLGAVIIYLALQWASNLRAIFIVIGALVLLATTEVFFSAFVTNSQLPAFFTSLTIRRALFIPPLLNDYYVQLFQSEPFVFWIGFIDSIFFLKYPLPMPPAFMIGMDFFGSERMSANTGFVGSGFANAGAFGTMVYAFFLGLAIAFIKNQANRLGTALVASVCLFTVYTGLTTSDLVTAFFSHGLFLNLVLLPFLPGRVNQT